MKRRFLRWTAFTGVAAGLALLLWAVPSLSNHGLYHADRHWSSTYYERVFTVEQAKALGYITPEPVECVPGMGYHYIKPDEAEAWFKGEAGGAQALLYDKTGFLVGVEYLFTAPGPDAPTILGMSGPMEPHFEGMPYHYEQHIYFAEPQCPAESGGGAGDHHG